MNLDNLKDKILELIRITSTDLPDDVVNALNNASQNEIKGSPAKQAVDDILKNINLAKEKSLPICQDTGTNYFIVEYPLNINPIIIKDQIIIAVKEACHKNYLRPNSVDPITGDNTGDSTGLGHPSVDFVPSKSEELKISLMLKGGGCENMSTQYSLPDTGLKAGRDIDGVKKCILDAVFKAQGFGCAPGILGVCIGGDRGDSMKTAKKQLFRKIGSINPDSILSEIENYVLEKANKLGIGPMGYGGKTTLLSCFITKLNRVPASFFLSVSYMCWASRHRQLTIFSDGRYEIE